MFHKYVLLFLIFFCFTEVVSKKKPNILIILADDVGTGDIPFYWNKNSLVEMPNLRHLASKGVTFKDAHSTPLCAPSRYMLLSGNYPHRGVIPRGSWSLNKRGQNQFLDNQRSIAEVLKTKGYTTMMCGKWHIGGGVPKEAGRPLNKTHILTAPQHDWSRPLLDGPQDIGFDHSYITPAGIQQNPYVFFRNGYLEIDPSEAVFWESGSYSMPRGTSIISNKEFGEGDPNWDSSAYNQILVEETKTFIGDHLEAHEDDPFFAYVALGSVHVPHSPPDLYDGEEIAGKYPTKHLDVLLEMDKVVGSLVSFIENKGLAEDTIIVFASDNGGLGKGIGTDPSLGHESNGPLRGSKGMVYEGGHRIPLIIRHDNHFPAGEERDRVVSLADMYATICELAGIDIPYLSAQDSISFARYLEDGMRHDGLRQNLANWDYQGTKLRFQAIRSGKMKLVHQVDTSTFELYNLEDDMHEKYNLYKVESENYDQLMNDMYEKLVESGPCPKDKSGSFALSGGNEDGLSVNCNWFRESSSSRCEEHLEGKLHCNSVCGNKYNKHFCAKLTLPTAPSIPNCQDTVNKFMFENGMKSCKSIEWRAQSVCYENVRIRSFCPVTCQDACKCINTVGKFRFKQRKRSCNWVSKNVAKRCKHWIFKSNCPEFCAEGC